MVKLDIPKQHLLCFVSSTILTDIRVPYISILPFRRCSCCELWLDLDCPDSSLRPMEAHRTLHFTSPGLRSQEIVIAPDLDDFTSKRRPLIESEDKLLDGQISELDQGTRARNRAFQERLDEIWRSTSAFDAKLRNEGREAVETILNMKESYQNHINKWNMDLQAEINSIFDRVDNELLPEQSARVDVIDASLDVFIKETVPAAIERQSGEVSRQLRRAYETFEIEKKKERKRESKLVDKASHHIQSTAQRFDDENALMSSCFFNLEDDIFEYERHAARLQLIRNAAAIEAVARLNAVSEAEVKMRAAEDVEVLDTVIETQGLLQKTVLLHFGTQAEFADFSTPGEPADPSAVAKGGFPVMHKLNQRMEKINAYKGVRESKSAHSEHRGGPGDRPSSPGKADGKATPKK